MRSFVNIQITFCAVIVGFSSFGQEVDCIEKARNGVFIVPQKGYEEYYLKRTESSQIEFIDKGKSKIYSDLTWLSDSTYRMEVTKRVKMPNGYPTTQNVYLFNIDHCSNSRYTMSVEYQGEIVEFDLIRKED